MNKEQIIEEMARDICECYNNDGTCYQDDMPCDLKCEHMTEAQFLYDKGYRKETQGEWVRVVTGFVCSVCGTHEARMTKFCPNCGAKMRGE